MKILTLSQKPNFMLFGFYAFMPDTSAWEWKAITFTSFLEACAKAREINYAECVCLGKSFRDPCWKKLKVTESGWKCCTVVEVEINLKYLCNIFTISADGNIASWTIEVSAHARTWDSAKYLHVHIISSVAASPGCIGTVAQQKDTAHFGCENWFSGKQNCLRRCEGIMSQTGHD